MLETYSERNKLTVVLLPLAKEVLSSYGNIPLKVNDLAKVCEQFKEQFGLKHFDLSMLESDNLWYIHQLELDDDNLKQRLISEIQ